MTGTVKYLGKDIKLDSFYKSSFDYYANRGKTLFIVNSLFLNANICFEKERDEEFVYFKPSVIDHDMCNYSSYDRLVFESEISMNVFLENNRDINFNGTYEIIKENSNSKILKMHLDSLFNCPVDDEKIYRIKKKFSLPSKNKIILYITPNENENKTNKSFHKQIEANSLEKDVSIFSFNLNVFSEKVKKIDNIEDLAEIFFIADIVLIPDQKLAYLGAICVLLNYPRYFLYLENENLTEIIKYFPCFGCEILKSEFYSSNFSLEEYLNKDIDYYTDKVIEKMFYGD